MSTWLVLASLPVVGGEFLAERSSPHLAGRFADVVALLVLAFLLAYLEQQRRHANEMRALAARTEECVIFSQTAAHIGSWEIGPDGKEIWSTSFRSLMGLAQDVPASTGTFRELVHPDDRDALAAADERMLAEPGEHEFEYRVHRPDGEIRWMLTRGKHIADARGACERILGVAMDITDRKAEEDARLQLEQQLIQAQKLETIGRLAGGVAHDFNNVLTGIGGYAELARAGLALGQSPAAALDEITAGTARAARLTRQLLAFSRKQVMREETIDLNDVVRGTEGLLERVIGEDVHLEHLRGEADVRIFADRTQIEQVLMNLVVNARDSMPDGGRITIEVGAVDVRADHSLDLEPGRFALLAVSDTGDGMDAETAARIFEPFFTTKPDGTGLGLATVHGIVTQSGGTIWVYSEPGSGTTFKIYLPFSDDACAPAVRGTPTAGAGAGEHVLVIEDDRQVRAIVRQMLVNRGFDVTTASDNGEAIACARSGVAFDVILSDLVMPDVSGRDLVAAVKEYQPRAAVIFMSGYSDDAVRRRGVLEPGSAFIEKPFSSEELVRRVRALLDARAVAA
jgi:PAS domain S-box-containing protein